jgi:hypothetical protein
VSRTVANTPVPHLGQPGASTVEAHAAHMTMRVNAMQELQGAFMGGPGFYAGNVAQREENAAGFEVAGSHLGQCVRAYEGEQLELLPDQAPLTLTSILAAEPGARIHRRAGAGCLTLRREQRGGGAIKDEAPLLYLDDETHAEADLIRDNWGRFVVDRDRKLFAPAVVTDELWVGGVPVLSLLTGAAATGEFSDADFLLYDSADATKIVQFVLNGLTTGTTRQLTVPDASGTIALEGAIPHGTLTGLTTGDAGHTQFALLAGRANGQSLTGAATGGTNGLTLISHADGGEAVLVLDDVGTTGAYAEGLDIRRPLAGGGAADDGILQRFTLGDDGGNLRPAAATGVRWVDPDAGAPVARWDCYLVDTGFPAADALAASVHPTLGGTSFPGLYLFGRYWLVGAGDPEGAAAAPVGSFFSRTDGGAGTSWYVKESGAGNTGWVAK